MKLSTILAPLNEALKSNLERPNKTQVLVSKHSHIEPKTVLEYARNCQPSGKKELEESETKLYVDNYRMEKLLEEALNEAYPKIPFSVSKDSHSTYILKTYELTAGDIGLDNKYNSEIDMFEYITSFKIKMKNTDFGKSDHYEHNIGKPERTRVVSEIVVDEGYDVDILEAITTTIKRKYERTQELKNTKEEKHKEFEDKLKEYGITLEQLAELNSLKFESGL